MPNEIELLSVLIRRAIVALENATTAAELLEAKTQADVAAARFPLARDAHDTILAACHKVQAEALMIMARAQCRLADEYKAAQDRGDVASGLWR